MFTMISKWTKMDFNKNNKNYKTSYFFLGKLKIFDLLEFGDSLLLVVGQL